jgi:predicted P-loop ATPase
MPKISDLKTTPSKVIPAPKNKVYQPLNESSNEDIFGFIKSGLKEHFTPGNRNAFIHVFASDCNRFGVSEGDCLNNLSQYAESDFPTSEIQQTIRSVYKRTGEHATKIFKKKNGFKNTADNTSVIANRQVSKSGEEKKQNNSDRAEQEKAILDDAIKIIKEASGDPLATANVIVQVVEKLIRFDSVKQDVLTTFICSETNLSQKLLRSELKKAISRKIREEKENGEYSDSMAVVTRVENFLNKHYKIRYNDIANAFELLDLDAGSTEWESMNENSIYRQLQKNHIPYSMSDLTSLLRSNFTEHYNPIKEYFSEGRAWDGFDHIADLSGYIKVAREDRKRFKKMFKKMFIRSVACSLEYTFNKHAFILVHEKQNSGKSTFLRWLCPPDLQEFYTENINTDKDSLIALTENFIINLDELSTLSKMELNALKSVMSKDKIKVRIPYDRRPSLIQRRCNFVGSTNRTEFLNDETGSVRWICFQIDSINWDYINNIDIDQVWAQAYYLFTHSTNRYDYQLNVEEIEENEEANRQFLVRTTEMELLQRFYIPGDENDFEQFMTASDIIEALQKKVTIPLKLTKVQIGKSLAMLGFKRDQRFNKEAGFQIKGYFMKNNFVDYISDKTAISNEANPAPTDVKKEASAGEKFKPMEDEVDLFNSGKNEKTPF